MRYLSWLIGKVSAYSASQMSNNVTWKIAQAPILTKKYQKRFCAIGFNGSEHLEVSFNTDLFRIKHVKMLI